MNKGTKKEVIWEYLKKKQSITAMDAWNLCRYGRLASYICQWEKNGISFGHVLEKKDGEHWTRYTITPEAIARAERFGLVNGKAKL